jgi:nucleotide-binding universal stress UspA family protein
MISHILVPLDGSMLAECVLPHILAVASSIDGHITLLHVLEPPHAKVDEQTIDPLEWHLKKREAGSYLNGIARRLHQTGLKIDNVILEGMPADCVIDFANNNDVTLIILSTHGRSGLSGWNVSSVVQKILLRSFKSTLLVRAYGNPNKEQNAIRYDRIFVGLDCSNRAECALPIAASLAQSHKAKLILGMVIPKPRVLNRFPLSNEDVQCVARIDERNRLTALQYFQGLEKQLSLQGIESIIQLSTSDNITSALHDMVDQQAADLVILAAHGHSGNGRWAYGSIATSFIAYGATSLMITQDLSADEIKKTAAEIATRESKGH